MKAVIQRVLKSSVTVDGELISCIGRGLNVLVGIHRDDTQEDVDFITYPVYAHEIFDHFDSTWLELLTSGNRRRNPQFEMAMWNIHDMVLSGEPRTNNSIEVRNLGRGTPPELVGIY